MPTPMDMPLLGPLLVIAIIVVVLVLSVRAGCWRNEDDDE